MNRFQLKPQKILRYLLFRLRHSENSGLMILAVGIGLTTGAAIGIFRAGIEFFHELFREQINHELLGFLPVNLAFVLSMGFAGWIVGMVMSRLVGHEKYHGVAIVIESVAYSGGKLPYRKIPFKAASAALSIGAGASVGPEDPSVQIGSNIGSFFGQILYLPEERVRLLVAIGAGSAIAAAFKAPIAGVFFALEVILNNTFSTRSVGAIVLAAVAASAFTQAIDPLNEMGPFSYQLGSPLEIPLFIPLGLAMGVLAAFFIRLVYWQQDFWHHYFDRLSRPAKTALAGMIVGLVAIAVPEITSGGREEMNAVLSGGAHLSILMLIVVGLVKMGVTSISLAGGFVGGIFAPTLFVGTMLGAAYGQLITLLVQHDTDPQAFAIAGMAAMMAGVVRSPITAIMMVFELTNDYRLILPIMLTTVLCIYLAQRFEAQGIYKLALRRQGVDLPEGQDIDLMQGITVGEAMLSPAPVIPAQASLLELRDRLREQRSNSICVVDEAGLLIGMVTLSDLQRAYSLENASELRVKDICSQNVITSTPDEILWKAIRKMSVHDFGRLPVVKPETREIVGLIGRHGIIRAYNIAMNRKLQNQHTAEHIRLNTLTGAHVFEVPVINDSSLAGQFIRDIPFPAESVVAAVKRNGRLLIPHGDTRLHAGDILTLVADTHAENLIKQLAEANNTEN